MTLANPTTGIHPDDTIVAVSSAHGPGARAIVHISGPRAREVLEHVFRARQDPTPIPQGERGKNAAWGRFLAPGFLTLLGVHSPLPASLYFFPGPHSYTGQDLAELHTIGSPPFVERLVADLLGAGARPAQPGEFTLRAFLAGKKDLPQAEAVNAVIQAGNDADLEHALTQLAGGITQPLQAIRGDLLNLLADLEAALDFADEDIEFVGKAETLAQLDAAIDQIEALERQLGDRAVSGRPGTRRARRFAERRQEQPLQRPLLRQGDRQPNSRYDPRLPNEVADTGRDRGGTDRYRGMAGFGRHDRGQAQQLGSEPAARSDVILWCDERGEFEESDANRLNATGAEVIRVRTKADLSSGATPQAISTSAITAGGTDLLQAALAECLAAIVRPPRWPRARAAADITS